jgi:hypothetical protein
MKKLLMAVAVLSACTGSSNYWRTYTPARGASTQPKTTVVQKATLAIVDAGYETETSDGNTGLVISKWFQNTGFMSEQNRFRIRVTVDETGHYEVTAQCQQKASGLSGGGWGDDCTDGKRPQFVLDAVAKVDAAIH